MTSTPLEGYRRLTFMMLDDDIVAVSPSSTYRVHKAAGRLDRKNVTPSKKVTGFVQPTKIQQEMHVDVSYINVGGTFYYLISALDGFSLCIVHWELRETMKEHDVELVISKAIEKHLGISPCIISDNGPTFIAKDVKEFIRQYGPNTRTNEPLLSAEKWQGGPGNDSPKSEYALPSCPATREETQKQIEKYVNHYKHVRLHSAMGYITPADCLAGIRQVIGEERCRKLESERERWQQRRSIATRGYSQRVGLYSAVARAS